MWSRHDGLHETMRHWHAELGEGCVFEDHRWAVHRVARERAQRFVEGNFPRSVAQFVRGRRRVVPREGSPRPPDEIALSRDVYVRRRVLPKTDEEGKVKGTRAHKAHGRQSHLTTRRPATGKLLKI